MPVWMEVLINVLGYAGFVGVATFNRSSEKMQATERDGRVSWLSSPRLPCARSCRP